MTQKVDDLSGRGPSKELLRIKEEYDALKAEVNVLGKELEERKKELKVIYEFSTLLAETNSTADFLTGVTQILSESEINTEACGVRIVFDGEEYKTKSFSKSEWSQSEDILVEGNKVGEVEVFYKKLQCENADVPFGNERKRLASAIGGKIGSIIKKKILETEVNVSEERFSKIFMENATPMILSDFDNEIKVIEVNKAFLELSGYSPDEIIGKRPDELGVIKDKSIVEQVLNDLQKFEQVKNYKLQLVNKVGKEVTTLLDAKFVVVKNSKYVLGSFIDISEAEEAKHQLEESNRQMHSVVHALDDAYLKVDNNGIILAVNNTAPKMFGYSSTKEMIGLPTTSIMSSEDREKMVAKLMKEKTLNDYTLHAKRKDKTRFWISLNMRPTYDADGNVNGRQEFARDITERIELEKQLMHSKEILERNEYMLNEAQDIARLGSWEWIIESDTIIGSKTFYHLLGFKPGSITPSYAGLEQFFSNEDFERLSEAVEKSLATGEPYELELEVIRSDKKTILLQIKGRVIRDDEGKIIGLRGTVLDIDKQKKLEKELILAKEKAEENELKFRNAFQNSGIGMCLVAIDGTFLKVNKAMSRILGYSDDELIRLTFQQITYPQDLNIDLKLLNETIEGKRYTYHLKKRYIHKTGKLVYANLNVSLIRNDEGAPLFFVSQIEDITKEEEYVYELKLAKEKAEESDRLKTAFLLNVSHEIRTPMNGILGFLELLNQPDIADEQRSEFVDLINKSGERLTNTINDIVEISKIEVGDLHVNIEEVDFFELMSYYYGLFKPQALEKDLDFHIPEQIVGEHALIKTDRLKLDGIVMNLIRNAIKFTDSGKIEFGNYIKDNKLCIFVSDTGTGIPEDIQDIIFNRFVQGDQGITRGYEGSGIGLSIVKAYVEVLGGEIEVQSEYGQGSTFLVSIPYQPVASSVKLAMKKDDLKQQAQTLLIVEDDSINRDLLKRMLENDYNLLFAETGKMAIEKFTEHSEISLVLMDIKMAGDCNGLEATKVLKSINSSIPVIAQTAYALDINRKEASDAGCDGYITKPYSVSNLKSVITSFL